MSADPHVLGLGLGSGFSNGFGVLGMHRAAGVSPRGCSDKYFAPTRHYQQPRRELSHVPSSS